MRPHVRESRVGAFPRLPRRRARRERVPMATAGPWQRRAGARPLRRPGPIASPRVPGVPSQGRAPVSPWVSHAPQGSGSPAQGRLLYPTMAPFSQAYHDSTPLLRVPPRGLTSKSLGWAPAPYRDGRGAVRLRPAWNPPRLYPREGQQGCSGAAVSLSPPEPAVQQTQWK